MKERKRKRKVNGKNAQHKISTEKTHLLLTALQVTKKPQEMIAGRTHRSKMEHQDTCKSQEEVKEGEVDEEDKKLNYGRDPPAPPNQYPN